MGLLTSKKCSQHIFFSHSVVYHLEACGQSVKRVCNRDASSCHQFTSRDDEPFQRTESTSSSHRIYTHFTYPLMAILYEVQQFEWWTSLSSISAPTTIRPHHPQITHHFVIFRTDICVCTRESIAYHLRVFIANVRIGGFLLKFKLFMFDFSNNLRQRAHWFYKRISLVFWHFISHIFSHFNRRLSLFPRSGLPSRFMWSATMDLKVLNNIWCAQT